MAKTNKLTKLKCLIKRWHSSKTIGQPADGLLHSSSFNGDQIPQGHRAVYVGKSHRKFVISAELAEHPIFHSLLETSGSCGGDRRPMLVHCEVVLFEHLLWMLENADPKPESIEEILEFYA